MQHIRICKFGPIREIDIDLNKSMEVVIGQQASGKSTFSKTVFFCKKIRDYFVQYLNYVMNADYPRYSSELYTNFLKYVRKPFLGYFGTTKHMEQFLIRYDYEKETKRSVSITLDKDRFAKFEFSPVMRAEICDMIMQAVEIAKYNNRHSLAEAYFQQTGFSERVKNSVNKIFCDDDMLVYIPAGRNLLAVIPDTFGKKTSKILHDSENELEIDIRQIDLITQEFVQYIDEIRADFGAKLEEITINYLKTVKGQIRNHDVELACELIRKILYADYRSDRDGEKLFYDDEHWVKLMFASSGQQEVVWALNIIFLTILKNKKTFLVFEEPESHLFPDSQETVAELVALMIYSSKSQVIITTHSPYMLTAINLLLYSGGEEKRNNGENVVVRKEFRLLPGTVGAYFLSRETGRLNNIVGERKKLIDAFAIDGVSESINDRMDQIMSNRVR